MFADFIYAFEKYLLSNEKPDFVEKYKTSFTHDIPLVPYLVQRNMVRHKCRT